MKSTHTSSTKEPFRKSHGAVRDDRLWERRRLNEEEPVKIGRGECLVGVVVHSQGRTDIQKHDFANSLRVVDTQFMCDSRATVMSTDVELMESEIRHHVDAVFGHGAFGIEFVVLITSRFGRGPIAS